ncbi:hypothetical protein AB0I99_18010 [Streptomyces spongiicola]|uniref:hypothetical protein n=1 Tax=Streptomyces spongiicola TaxID=1690221 RepID=UPI0033DDDCE0
MAHEPGTDHEEQRASDQIRRRVHAARVGQRQALLFAPRFPGARRRTVRGRDVPRHTGGGHGRGTARRTRVACAVFPASAAFPASGVFPASAAFAALAAFPAFGTLAVLGTLLVFGSLGAFAVFDAGSGSSGPGLIRLSVLTVRRRVRRGHEPQRAEQGTGGCGGQQRSEGDGHGKTIPLVAAVS